jgi:hypothetical protein
MMRGMDTLRSHARLYIGNVALGLAFGLGVLLLALAWFDTVGYVHFIGSWRNL